MGNYFNNNELILGRDVCRSPEDIAFGPEMRVYSSGDKKTDEGSDSNSMRLGPSHVVREVLDYTLKNLKKNGRPVQTNLTGENVLEGIQKLLNGEQMDEKVRVFLLQNLSSIQNVINNLVDNSKLATAIDRGNCGEAEVLTEVQKQLSAAVKNLFHSVDMGLENQEGELVNDLAMKIGSIINSDSLFLRTPSRYDRLVPIRVLKTLGLADSNENFNIILVGSELIAGQIDWQREFISHIADKYGVKYSSLTQALVEFEKSDQRKDLLELRIKVLEDLERIKNKLNGAMGVLSGNEKEVFNMMTRLQAISVAAGYADYAKAQSQYPRPEEKTDKADESDQVEDRADRASIIMKKLSSLCVGFVYEDRTHRALDVRAEKCRNFHQNFCLISQEIKNPLSLLDYVQFEEDLGKLEAEFDEWSEELMKVLGEMREFFNQ